jgi:mono/diheme cytochrome c family protein
MRPNHGLEIGRQRLSPIVMRFSGGVLLAGALFAAPLCSTAASAAVHDPPTYSREIAPILQANCQECHRPGGIGPFSLLTYGDARSRAAQLEAYTRRRIMPPWKAADGFGEFADARRLTDEEIATIARWVEAGAPEGDPEHLPPPRQFPEGWTLGTPDLVLDAGEAFEVPARGPDIYRNFVLPLHATEDLWVSAVEVAPDSSEVVHHVVLYLDPQGKSLALDKAQPGPGFTVFGVDAGFSPAVWMQGWAPGAMPRFLPEGTAWKIPARSYLVMQVHYHPHGHAVKDRTRIGLHFASGPVEKRVRVSAALGNLNFQIPPGAARYPVSASVRLPDEISMLTVWPHMHQLGREMKVTATLPDGSVKPVVWIPEWDFHWQLMYTMKQPLKLPQGTRLELKAYYDNSAENPHNPNRPPKAVRFGPQTTDEMCFCFFLYTVDAEQLTLGLPVENDPLELRL